MSNAAAVMMSQSGSMPSSMVAGGAGTELQPRTPRPSSQPGGKNYSEHCSLLEMFTWNIFLQCASLRLYL